MPSKSELEMSRLIKPGSASLRVWQLLLLVAILLAWHFATLDPKVAFFFGQPLEVWGRIWAWFVTNGDIYRHLWVTLAETVLAFFIGTVFGMGFGLWLGLSSTASAILDPYIKAANSMPRVILAPIFGMWLDRKSTRLNSSHVKISYAVFCLTKNIRTKILLI